MSSHSETKNQLERMDHHGGGGGGDSYGSGYVDNLYQNWFLDYASYVILDRAVPNIDDGLKPVQRRILYALKELDDGRFNKAANIIGHTMRYHPHGDMAIEDALVKLAQKELLFDLQGNWGNLLTGDRAAAPRYIETRLSEFAKELVFNDKLTSWQISYDGRNKEPIVLPIKFPLLLATGVEGIAVGLSTKILPHNINELIDASIEVLRGNKATILPDFQSGGIADFTQYRKGARGGKVRIRAKIELVDNRTLKISEIPYATTTSSIIDSIIAANDKGKIKIKRVEDNTASDVEILVYLPNGVSPFITIDALYAFTDCEVSISPNCCVIEDDKPIFSDVESLLEHSANRTKSLLRQELEIEHAELLEKLHFVSLELIFIEEKIYRNIESAETWQEVIDTISSGLKPFRKDFIRDVTQDDIVKLTEIKIKRISKFDREKAEKTLLSLQEQIEEVEKNLKSITRYTIQYYKKMKKKYGARWDRKTKIEAFSEVKAKAVAMANLKLYVNRKEGFIGTSLKKDEFVTECSELDEIIVFRKDGQFLVTKVTDKAFVGKNIIHIDTFKRQDEDRVYHMIYQVARKGPAYAKRFNVTSITRDREYDLTKNTKNPQVLHFSVNPSGEGEVVELIIKDRKQKPQYYHLDFSELPIQSRAVRGQEISDVKIDTVELVERDAPKEKNVEIWFDAKQRRCNCDGIGQYIGSFSGNDQIYVLYKNGAVELTGYGLDTYFDKNILHMGKLKPATIVSCVYYHGEKKDFYVKRFNLDELSQGRRENFISPQGGSKLVVVSLNASPSVIVSALRGKKAEKIQEQINIAEYIDVKGIKAIGNKLSRHKIKSVKLVKS
jgi:topoisomerase-4 subunit A